MSGALAGAVAVALLVGTGVFAAATPGVGRVAEFALAAYVLAFAEVVALSLLLSAFGLLTRAALLAGAVVLLAASVVVWRRAGSPRPFALRRDRLPSLRGPLLVLAGVAALALAYVAALDVATPPNGWDQLNYHLPRAAFWLQNETVGYLAAAYDERLNFNPPNGEIAVAFVLGVTAGGARRTCPARGRARVRDRRVRARAAGRAGAERGALRRAALPRHADRAPPGRVVEERPRRRRVPRRGGGLRARRVADRARADRSVHGPRRRDEDHRSVRRPAPARAGAGRTRPPAAPGRRGRRRRRRRRRRVLVRRQRRRDG